MMSAHGPDLLLFTGEGVEERSDFSPLGHMPEFGLLHFHHFLPHEGRPGVLDVVAPFGLLILLPLSLLGVSDSPDPPFLITVL